MFEILISFIAGAIIIYLFRYPGAMIRWLLSNKNKSFNEILSEDIFINSFVGLMVLVPLIGFIILIFK